MLFVRRLPPLGTLRAFEAAARHLSFKEAARELGLTPMAISHQIRLLEEYCGEAYFAAVRVHSRFQMLERSYSPQFATASTTLHRL
jgi:Bacterial regulatory helix-turn-helix protein, lysR family